MWKEINKFSNIYDPISKQLDQRVFKGETPRPIIINFIRRKIFSVLRDAFVDNPEKYFSLYLTGSLTTFQYSDASDCDISIFPNYDLLVQAADEDDPEEIRRILIAIVTTELDGTDLPGTPHPLQDFIQPKGLTPADIFKSGERSAWDFQTGRWIVPPERERTHDVMNELPDLFQKAQAVAEKMTILLDNKDYQSARDLYAEIHKKRTKDEKAGLGDFSEGNIEYKWLLHAGLFDRLNEEAGMHLAKVSAMPLENPISYQYIPLTSAELEQAIPASKVFENSASNLNFRASKVNAPGKVTAIELAAMYNRYEGKCAYDGKYGADSWDHVIPLSRGGTNDINNLLPVHSKCNNELGRWDYELEKPGINYNKDITISPDWLLHRAEASADEPEHFKVIYDFDKDEIILGTTAAEEEPKPGMIIGDYDGKNVHLYGLAKQWINANYFKRLWLNSFPSRPIEKIFFEKTHIPTRPSKEMTYVQKLPHLVSTIKESDRWRDGKTWKDYIKNRGIIVDFRIGDSDDDPIEGKIVDFDSDSVKIQLGSGAYRTFDSDLLRTIKFKVRDDKHSVN